MSAAGGSVLGTSPGIVAFAFQPKRSAASTSGLRADLHAQRGEHRVARVGEASRGTSRRTTRRSRSRAPRRRSIACVSTGNSVDGFTTPRSSAAVVVTILNVEPGGCGAEKAMPASARTSPLRGSSAATPPSRPASADHGRLLEAGVDRRPHRPGRGRGFARASTRPPGEQLAARAPAQPLLEHLLEAASAPPASPRGKPCAYSARARRRSPRRHAARRSSPRSPTSGERARSAPAPRRAPCRQRAERRRAPAARSPAGAARRGRSSGNTSRGDQATRSSDDRDPHVAAVASRTRASATHDRDGAPCRRPPVGSSGSSCVAVAVAAGALVGAPELGQRVGARAARARAARTWRGSRRAARPRRTRAPLAPRRCRRSPHEQPADERDSREPGQRGQGTVGEAPAARWGDASSTYGSPASMVVRGTPQRGR